MPLDMFLEPWIVGDISTVGLHEELMESQVNDAIDYIRKQYGMSLTVQEMEDVLELFDIDYPLLPEWLKDKLDMFDVE